MKKFIFILCILAMSVMAFADGGDTPGFWYDDLQEGEFWIVDADGISVNASGFTYDGTDFTLTGNINASGFMIHSTTAGITAGTTQTQSGAILLTTDINEISTCANANDGVKLPSAVAGLEIFIINNGAETAKVYPNTSDNLGAGVDTATTLAAGATVTFVSYDATNWVTK